jgi:putative Mn2+ efflux pump MntP
MAVAFSVSTAALPLIGWVLGLAIYRWIVSLSAWAVLIVFAMVGIWMINKAFGDEESKWVNKTVSSFWSLSVMGTLGSLDEGAVGISYPFLGLPILWIVLAVILTNTVPNIVRNAPK